MSLQGISVMCSLGILFLNNTPIPIPIPIPVPSSHQLPGHDRRGQGCLVHIPYPLLSLSLSLPFTIPSLPFSSPPPEITRGQRLDTLPSGYRALPLATLHFPPWLTNKQTNWKHYLPHRSDAGGKNLEYNPWLNIAVNITSHLLIDCDDWFETKAAWIIEIDSYFSINRWYPWNQ